MRAGISTGLLTLGSAIALLCAAGVPAQSVAADTQLSSMGDAKLGALMDAWMADYHQVDPKVSKGRWVHFGATATPHGLTNGVADVAPIVGEPSAMTYRIRFQRNGVEKPFLLKIGTLAEGGDETPLYLAANGGTNRPLEPKVAAFFAYVLSARGQAIVARQPGYRPLSTTDIDKARGDIAGLLYIEPAMAPYKPGAEVSGPIESVGSIQMAEWIDRAFAQFIALHPKVYKGYNWRHPGSSAAISGILTEVADIAPLGREVSRGELKDYRARFGDDKLLTIEAAHGARASEIRSNAVAIYVNAANPIKSLTVAQLDAIFSKTPKAGAPAAIRTWGQTGVTGSLSPATIHPLIYADSGAPGSIQSRNFRNDAWSDEVKRKSMAEIAAAVAADASSIGFGEFDDPTPGIRQVPIAYDDKTPPSLGSLEDVARQVYPLTRSVFILLRRNPTPQTKEFVRFLLSRDGQRLAVLEGYSALTPAEAAAQLAKLD